MGWMSQAAGEALDGALNGLYDDLDRNVAGGVGERAKRFTKRLWTLFC